MRLLSRPELQGYITSTIVPDAKLCIKCGNMDFAEMSQIVDILEELRSEASSCDFCKMRWDLGKHSFSDKGQSILFEVADSNLQLFRRPVISFLACHEGLGASVCLLIQGMR